VPVPDYRHQPGPARHPVPQGYEQFRISWIAPDNPRKSGDRDHAGVALADLPATRPGAVRPHPALHGHYAFSNCVFELESPVTESNRKPSPYHAYLFRPMASGWVGLLRVRGISVSGHVALCRPLPGGVVPWFVTGSRNSVLFT
jgi:hypothetical protein